MLEPLLVGRERLVEDVALALDGEAERLDKRGKEANGNAQSNVRVGHDGHIRAGARYAQEEDSERPLLLRAATLICWESARVGGRIWHELSSMIDD